MFEAENVVRSLSRNGRCVFDSAGIPLEAALDGPCPDTSTLLTYSQSSEPGSPHASDQTELFSEQRWVTERFCEADILELFDDWPTLRRTWSSAA